MKKKVIITLVLILVAYLTFHFTSPIIFGSNSDYVEFKIKQLEEMPCSLMSEIHIHELENQHHYQAYDKKFVECFGYVP